MKHTIEKMKQPLVFQNDKGKKIITDGYAFIDEDGGTIIIVYGDGLRDEMSKYLNSNGDILHLKYSVKNLVNSK
jgi:hypothetical protein